MLSRNITTGILAHVDAGKTTLIESMLLSAGAIRKAGRVDHQDAFLDYDQQERSRGITIFSKQAGCEWDDRYITIIDTPGHADFSAEMERALSVLDCAIVLVSANEGVQAHTRTIWKCLETYNIPAFLFVNKMDAAHRDKEALLEDLRTNLDDRIVDWMAHDRDEQAASLEENLLDEFIETQTLQPESLQQAIGSRQVFPVLFGSALKNEGIKQMMDTLSAMTPAKIYPNEFGARVFKISEDDQGNLLTHIKLTGGTLKVKEIVEEQKVDQIRRYQGQGYQAIPEATAGDVVTIKGWQNRAPGDGLGFEPGKEANLLSPCLMYELILPDGLDPVQMMGYLRALMMEDPTLQVEFDDQRQTISLRLMGEIQKEILRNKIYDRAGSYVEFGPGRIVFQETIAQPVYGYGHFEPLRHYAEVHLRLEPGKRGSGLVFSSALGRDVLSLNWQRLILSALGDAHLNGVLTNSPLTDMKITLIAGRAHNKHTQGGDFRQAALRAVRQGLKKAENILLEPFFKFEIQTDPASLSRILYELEVRQASVSVEEMTDNRIQITGRGPVRTLLNFQEQLNALSHGNAQLTLDHDGYDLCQQAQTIIEEIGYQEEHDRAHPSGSVFCVQGSGEYVPWDEVEEHLHIPPVSETTSSGFATPSSSKVSEEEIRRIFAAAGGANRNEKKRQPIRTSRRTELSMEPTHVESTSSLPVCLIVDGYNMIYSWPELKAVASKSLFQAREELISLLVNYQGYKGWSLIVVFDGHRRADNPGSSQSKGSSRIVYTPKGQSADSYIEKKAHDLKGKFQVIAATSDALIQNSVLSHGARRISARELEQLVYSVNQEAFKSLQSTK